MFRLLLVCGLFFGACGERGPDAAAQAFVEKLGMYQSNPFPKNLKPVYDALDTTTRTALDARAGQLSSTSNAEIKPWEALSYRGLTDGVRVAGYEVVEQGADAAIVEIRFASVVPKGQGGPVKPPEPVRLTMRVEAGEWRFGLPLWRN
ncbi:MAG: hypothetical protein ACI9MR_003051 [Myxococcota bacterium]|jgi:hypothetical protein